MRRFVMNASTWAHTDPPFAGLRTCALLSILAALYPSEEQIHIFDELGYKHNPCAKGESAWAHGKCDCDPSAFRWVFLRSSGVVGDDSRG